MFELGDCGYDWGRPVTPAALILGNLYNVLPGRPRGVWGYKDYEG